MTANNVTAEINYRHYDKRDEATAQAVWAAIVNGRSEFVERVHIESGQTASLVMLGTYIPQLGSGSSDGKTDE